MRGSRYDIYSVLSSSRVVIRTVAVKMCLIKYHVILLCLIALECYALNCRSDGGPKEADLKNIYKKCLKMQDSKNASKGNSDQEWKESRGQSHKNNNDNNNNNNWDKDQKDSSDNKNTKHDRISSRGKLNDNVDMMGRNNDRRVNSSNDRKGSSSDSMGRDGDGMTSNSDRTGNRDRMGGRNGRENTPNYSNDRYGSGGYYNGRDSFSQRQGEEYGSDMPQYNSYYSTQSPRRYKREKRPENSGQRSQYNPNTHKNSGYVDNFRREERNATDNSSSKEVDNKACALHCFMENLEMTAEDGLPDKYLVTHAITKDVKNEDLKDFLQESIEECFQIMDNENTEEKCEFAKNILVCLSEKGRANCDDWRDDLKF